MLRSLVIVLAVGAAAAWSAESPVIDNEHVTVWDTASALPPSAHDFVAVLLSNKGQATFGHQAMKLKIRFRSFKRRQA